ncbi:MAG: glycosyl transferase group 1 [Acidimicrobiales bacterium]|nr:glycosyl transferase group 1 [Acidimicrobiales bacterium]
MATPDLSAQKLGDIAAEAGLRRIHLLAWRDLDDEEAGGSEVHASTVARLWAEAGIDVTIRTSTAQGQPPDTVRDGYRVVRKAGRYLVFPRSVLSAVSGRMGERDGLVEIWNGMPFLSPVWVRGPRAVWLHHVHKEMWRMMLPAPLARVGDLLERRLAPPLYRRTPLITLSESSRHELVHELGFRPELVSVIPPGIDPVFSPGGERSSTPLVVAVGRLAPVKRFALLLDVLLGLKVRHPQLEAVLVGDGTERPALEARIAAAGAGDWIQLPGRLSETDLVDLYRRAWVLASASAREGWGMTITEAAACATPAVVTDISGHSDAVVDGETGLLAPPVELGAALDRVLADVELRARLSAGAVAHAARFTWEATAEGTLQVLADDARRRRLNR